MSGTISLFQKYRSQSFDDLVGQEVVVKTLGNALKNGNPAHVYLFCGPRGTGKTSTARILAKALNCAKAPTIEPCNECESCKSIANGSDIDLIELDAASNTQVDKIRDVIVEKVCYAPAHSRYKIFIIDEVHMLSGPSFNALLKTLEEPPEHVIFILATTDPHKLPSTVLSRCQRHDFQRLSLSQISSRIKYVVNKEGMECTDEAAELLARAADGSMRDALSALGAVASLSEGHITAEMAELALGLSGSDSISKLIDGLLRGDVPGTLSFLEQIINSGRDLVRLSGEMCEYLRRIMLVIAGAADRNTFDMSEEQFSSLKSQASRFTLAKAMGWLSVVINMQSTLSQSNNARILWEMMIIRLAIPSAEDTLQGLGRRIERLEMTVFDGVAPILQNNNKKNQTNRNNVEVTSQKSDNVAVSVSSSIQSKAQSLALNSAPENKNYPSSILSSPKSSINNSKEHNSVPQNNEVKSQSALVSEANSKQDLGWKVVKSTTLTRPAPKKSVTVLKSDPFRAIPDSDKNIDSESVRKSWGITKTEKQPVSSFKQANVMSATEAELSDLKNLWLGFVKFIRESKLSNLANDMLEAKEFVYNDGVLDVYFPKDCACIVDSLRNKDRELNKLLKSYRNNINLIHFYEDEDDRSFSNNKEEYDSLVKQIISIFGAEEIKTIAR